MFKSAVLCVALAGTTASSVWLWHQWRNEREAKLQLLARLETRQPQPKTPTPPPVATIPALPAGPTNGCPLMSSSSPGCSPMNITDG